ncbi:gp3 [Listeria phage P35]|uniref:portal protein n=1 Tax=Listeria phage P35 TaxID=330398 RepID=UPI00015C01EF|nr:portal protein [Listeria phage P35]AAY53188.1 gp3 [Listeria phage P35]
MTSPLLNKPIDQLGGLLNTEITTYMASNHIKWAHIGENYYNQENDIEKSRIFYMNDKGQLREDNYASNVKISHGFFTELVDQLAQYLLSNGVEVKVKDEDNTQLDEILQEYFDEDFQATIDTLVTNASKKGFEGIFARTTSEGKLKFQTVDGLTLIPVFDDYGVLKMIIRWYSEIRYSTKQQSTETIWHADVWNEEAVCYYIQDDEGVSTTYKLDEAYNPNPAPHVLAIEESTDADFEDTDGYQVLGRSYSKFPFQLLYNNKDGMSDVKRVKSIIDDYDVMNCFLSNNLQDFSEAIYVVKGFSGDSTDKLRQNIKAKKMIGVNGDNAGMEIQTVSIPYEARKAKMDIDVENIYRSGMGFNSTAVGDGNVTNVVIKSRYTLLAMKARKMETSLRKVLRWCADMVVSDIALRGLGEYDSNDICFEIEPHVLANELDIATTRKTEAETEALKIGNIMTVAPRIGDDETLKLIAEELDLDYNELKDALAEQDAQSLDVSPDVQAMLDGLPVNANQPPVDPNQPVADPNVVPPTDPNAVPQT